MGLLTAIAGTALVTAVWMAVAGLTFPLSDLWNPLLIAVLLGGGAAYYRSRGEQNFAACLLALLQVTLYTAVFSVLMYTAATTGRPLIDDWLVRSDRLLGVHVPSLVEWTNAHTRVQSLLQMAYNSLLWQTPLLIVLLGFSGDLKGLRQFVHQFVVATLVCVSIFSLFPAEGPFSAYGYPPSDTQARYLDHLHSLRDGSRTIISWNGAEGLITFPSFHTTWAILLSWGLRRFRGLWLVAVLVNLTVIASTLTTGWHYGTDVIGGVITAVAAIALSLTCARQQATQSAASAETPLAGASECGWSTPSPAAARILSAS